MNQYQHRSKDNKITEGLRREDLKDMIDHIFTVDQYQSKMGKDEDIIVLKFRAFGKEPAIDLMEFIERGYPCVLDADISTGEERDGNYSVFVELERNKQIGKDVEDLLSGISQLCGFDKWRFRWYKDHEGHDFSKEEFLKVVPTTPEEYNKKSNSEEIKETIEFFNQGALDDIIVDEHRYITFKKMFSESLKAKLIAIGEYNTLKQVLQGPLQLDEASRSQVVYLNKYLGNYDINKIEGHFLIRNGTRAVILSKEIW